MKAAQPKWHSSESREHTMMNTSKRILTYFALLTLLLGDTLSSAVLAQDAPTANSVQAINVTTQNNGDVVVKIQLKQALTAVPGVFAVNNPPRIALDFPNTLNGLGKNVQAVDQGDLRNINVVQAGDRTRLVLNLGKPLGYDKKIEDGALVLTLQQNVASNATATSTHFAEPQANSVQHSLSNIDFKRGTNGEGKIVVDLSDTGIGIDLRKQGRSLIIDFLGTSLPDNLRKRYDATSFGTLVQTFDAVSEAGHARIVVTPTGQWEHSAYQTDKQFVVEIKPIVEDPSKLVQGSRAGYTGEKLSLNFQNVEVRAVLQVIADFTGFNFITSDTVTGNLTLRLKDVPWDQALDIILQTKGLAMRKNGDVVWIAPRDEIMTKEKLAMESQAQIADIEPLQTESFQLNYAQATQVVIMLRGGTGGNAAASLLTKRGSAVIDKRTNTIFVQETASRLDQIRDLIRKVDIPVRQVLIEARIVDATDNFERDLGAKLGVGSNVSASVGGNSVSGSIGGALSGEGSTATNDTNAVSLPVSGSAISLMLYNAARTKFLNLELSASEADTKTKTISNPRVITADQTEATISKGLEIPYTTVSNAGTNVSFKDAVLSLKVTPQITPDDHIIMTLDINNDTNSGDAVNGEPIIGTEQVHTQALVENGGTVVLGGIYNQVLTDTTTKVPLLGDIPLLGVLFRKTQKGDNRTELLVFISPHIIKNDFLSTSSP